MINLIEELTTGPLATELAPYIAIADEDSLKTIKEIFERKDIVVPGNLSVHDIKQYISLLKLRLAILDSTTMPCREFNTAIEDFKDSGFDLSNELIYNRVVEVLDGLISDETLVPAFTETNKAILLSLGNKVVSRAEQLGVNISITDLVTAIFNTDGSKNI